MKNIINNAVDKYRELILAAERQLWSTPETGFKEYKTSAYMAEQFEKLGYKLTYAEGITGFYTVVDTGREGPEVLILGELDSVICPTHPEADKETGAVHACGHHAQCAGLLGIAAALTEKELLDTLSGRIRLCAVPAEELLEIEYRTELKSKGIIKYLGGKSEFLRRGYFDGVDIALMVHTGGSGFNALKGMVGCVTKRIIYKGRAAHGGEPHLGINALYAANCGLNAINAIRETFTENDRIRVHPIITNGGAMVNAIPETVTLESYVRGKTFEAIKKENRKVNRALIGAALSIGANIEIIDTPGYSPLQNNQDMIDVARDALALVLPDETFRYYDMYEGASTDMGDMCSLFPTVHPNCPGSIGSGHGNNYYIKDPEAACVKSAKWQLGMLYTLLGNGAERGDQIVREFKPLFASKEEFLAYQDSLCCSGDRIIYKEDGNADVKLV